LFLLIILKTTTTFVLKIILKDDNIYNLDNFPNIISFLDTLIKYNLELITNDYFIVSELIEEYHNFTWYSKFKSFDKIIFDDFNFEFIEEHIDTIEDILKIVVKDKHKIDNFSNIKTLLDILINYDTALEQNNYITVSQLIQEYHQKTWYSIQEQIKELDLEIEAKMKLREYLYNQL
jgi:hypothetical protein